MKKFFVTIGNFLICMLPMLFSIVLQLAAAIVYAVAGIAIAIQQSASEKAVDPGELTQLFTENVMVSVLIYQILGIIIFSLWYYFAYGRKKSFQDRERPGVRAVPIIVAAGMLSQFFISGILGLIETFIPEALSSYMEMMEMSGLTQGSVLTVLCTVLLAPIGEELLCRGIIFRLARRVSMKFFVANIIQAFAFGFLHLNLVQGTYAFVLGLILGYLYGKYRNIFLCMLLHASLNASSFFVDLVWSAVPDSLLIPVIFGFVLVSGGLLVFCYQGLGKIRLLKEDGISFPAVKSAG